MREIKFRAWHKETKSMLNIWSYEWIKGHFAGTETPNEFFNNEFELTPDGNSCNRIKGKSVFLTLDGQIIGVLPMDDKTTQSVNYSDEYELMQFTGLKDKNGKEIYEGDLISESGSKAYEVIWQYHSVQWIMQYAGEGRGYRHMAYDYALKNYEVIGNIYENPDLLK